MERKLSLLDAYTQIPKRIGVMSMAREEALKKMQAFIDFFPTAKTEIEEIISALSKPTWHSADEVPPKDTNILIETSFFGEDSLEYYSYYWCYPAVPGWVEYVKEYHVKRWAYISDLLQKKIKI